MKHGPDELSVTISIGVAQQIRDEGVEMLLKRADEAMYLSKNNGRNQVTKIS